MPLSPTLGAVAPGICYSGETRLSCVRAVPFTLKVQAQRPDPQCPMPAALANGQPCYEEPSMGSGMGSSRDCL